MSDVQGHAVIDASGSYRYRLTRQWAAGPLLPFVMLNPSTADALADDPTIRRCIGFARREGAAGILVANLYALRATDPAVMLHDPDPVGPENDEHLRELQAMAAWDGSPIIAAWGVNAEPERVEAARAILSRGDLRCLGVTKAGAPRHPLYVRGDAPLVPWPVR